MTPRLTVVEVNGLKLTSTAHDADAAAMLVMAEMSEQWVQDHSAEVERCFSNMVIYGYGELWVGAPE